MVRTTLLQVVTAAEVRAMVAKAVALEAERADRVVIAAFAQRMMERAKAALVGGKAAATMATMAADSARQV